MAEIQVTTATLKSKSSEFSADATEVKGLTDQMFAIIKQLNGAVWSGTAATTYTTRFNKLDNDCTKMFKMIKEFSDDLTDIATEYDTAEKANEETGRALKVDVIS